MIRATAFPTSAFREREMPDAKLDWKKEEYTIPNSTPEETALLAINHGLGL